MKIPALVLLGVLLTSCGSSSTPSAAAPTPVGVVGSVFDGPVSGSTLNLFHLQPDGTLGEFRPTVESYPVPEPDSILQVVTSTHEYAFELDGETDPVVIEVSGGTDRNVVTGVSSPLPPGLRLRAAVPPPLTGSVHITPFTTLACELALAQIRAGVDPRTAVTGSNAAMARMLGLRDLLSTAPFDPGQLAPEMTSSDSLHLTMLLAGMSQQAAETRVSLASLILGLQADVDDGRLDGMRFGSPLYVLSDELSPALPAILQPTNTKALPPDAMTARLARAAATFQSSANNRSGRLDAPEALQALAASTGVLVEGMPVYRSPYALQVPVEAGTPEPAQESLLSFDRWFDFSAYSNTINRQFGPTPFQYPPPAPPVLAPGQSLQQWQQQRVVATAARYLGHTYQHHHVPDWNPAFDPDWPWLPVSLGMNFAGIDCSDFSQWNYNYGLGLKLGPPDVPQDAVTAVPGQNTYTQASTWDGQSQVEIQTVAVGGQVPYARLIEQLQPGDLLYIENNSGLVTHVIMWLGELARDEQNGDPTPLIIDSHDNKPPVYDSNGVIVPAGVRIRPFYQFESHPGAGDNWYFTHLSVVHRIIHP